MSVKFAARTEWPRTPNRLAEAISQAEADGRTVLNLTETNPTRCSLESLGQELLTHLSDKNNLIYEPHPQGLLESRVAITRYYHQKGVNIITQKMVS